MTAYREALELARAAGDPVAEFAILVDYGRNGSPDAADWFARAAAIVDAKADSLTDPAQRQSHLERVPLSAAILGREGG